MFADTKAGHLAHIFTTSMMGTLLTREFEAPTPSEIEAYGHLIIQALVAVVTIWTMIRKSLQKPERVVQMPAAVPTVVVPPKADATASSTSDRRVPEAE